jgi:enamine deaminase RidA (YjgF/YER057c/UK114 family)
MANLVTTVQASGAELSDVVKTMIYVASRRPGGPRQRLGVIHASFGDHDASSTLLGVSVLGDNDQLVEVEAIAVRAL